MRLLFLTLLDFESIDERSIYTDLLREFYNSGHEVYAISPVEKRKGIRTYLLQTEKASILKLQIGNTQKTNIFEKGISTLCVESQFIRGIKNYFGNVKFNLVLYSTPPITFSGAIEYVKRRDNAKTYLMLKDIFPQNAVDLGMLSNKGIRGILYRYFRHKEKKLYEISDRIGCMSQANVDYLLKHNPEIRPDTVEICANSIEPIDKSVDEETRINIRNKYNIPLNKIVFVYGGNLGKPQGIDFLIECLKSQKSNSKVFFLIVGDGTEYGKIQRFVEEDSPSNVCLMQRLPKEDYDTLVGACDVGMIFLDYRFTIPNFPSRLLSYMQAKLPVLAVTDANTDVGKIITEGEFGWWCESNSIKEFGDVFRSILDEYVKNDFKSYGLRGYEYLLEHYTAHRAYEIINN